MDTAVSSRIIDCLPPRERARLLDRAVARRVAPGEILYLAGDRERRVHIVTGGVVKMTARSAQGTETILCLALPGDVVGDIAAVDSLPQPLDAIAATRAAIVGLDADLFIEIVSASRIASIELSRALAARMRWICETALERTTGEVPARLAGRLLDLADLMGAVRQGAIEIDLPLAQRDLGRLAGMCRESTCKTLRRFKSQGMLDYEGRRLRILRPDALERIRCGGRAARPSP